MITRRKPGALKASAPILLDTDFEALATAACIRMNKQRIATPNSRLMIGPEAVAYWKGKIAADEALLERLGGDPEGASAPPSPRYIPDPPPKPKRPAYVEPPPAPPKVIKVRPGALFRPNSTPPSPVPTRSIQPLIRRTR